MCIRDRFKNLDKITEQSRINHGLITEQSIPKIEEEVEEEALIMEELDEFGYAVDDDHSNLKNIEEDIPEYEKEE